MRVALVLILAASGAPAIAESAFEMVFRSGTLDAVPPGTELIYEDAESAVGGAPAEARSLALVLDQAGRARVEARGDGEPVPLGGVEGQPGNPMAMVFLERTVASVAEATGGSPFYIRNRIRDALGAPAVTEPVTVPWDGEDVAATAVTLVPFAEDEHRAQLGAFADLTLRVVVSEEVPGWYLSLDAETPPVEGSQGYTASLALRGAE